MARPDLIGVLIDFKFSEIEKAYDIFGKAAENKALKMNITFD